ncbi:putative integrase [Sulfuracidifex tepidarius]|uniref:putative integrase n=1 Tax=Sulfuracidifex tepidarius TaxID=1294262 RepID=UPI00351EFEE0
MENDLSGKRRDNYIAPLDQVVKDYYDIRCRGRDLNPGQGLDRLDSVSVKRGLETFSVAR